MRLAASLLVLLVVAGISAAQSSTNFDVGPQYLITTDNPMFLHPIATPSLSLQPASPVPPAMQTNPGTTVELSAPPSAVMAEPDLSRILWGDAWVDYVQGIERVSVIEITGTAKPNLPPSFFDTGVTGMTNEAALRGQGYGLTLGEVSAQAKSRPRPTHVYTNDDIRRLHGG